MIGRRALVHVEFQGYVPRFVLECGRCSAFVAARDRDALVFAACEAGWAPDEDSEAAEAYLCPAHAHLAGDL